MEQEAACGGTMLSVSTVLVWQDMQARHVVTQHVWFCHVLSGVLQIRQLLALQVVTLRNQSLPEGFMGSAIVLDLARTTAPRLNLYNSFRHDCRIQWGGLYSDCMYLHVIDMSLMSCKFIWFAFCQFVDNTPNTLRCRLSHSRVLGLRCHLWPSAGFSQDFETTDGLSCSLGGNSSRLQIDQQSGLKPATVTSIFNCFLPRQVNYCEQHNSASTLDQGTTPTSDGWRWNPAFHCSQRKLQEPPVSTRAYSAQLCTRLRQKPQK